MDKARKLQNCGFMQEIKKLIKPIFMLQIEEAIDDQNVDLIEKLLRKYLRKREAQLYLPKILMALRRYNREQTSQRIAFRSFDFQRWPKQKIISYLKQKLEVDEMEQVLKCVELKNQDLCNTLIQQFLRFQEAQQILPHISQLFTVQTKQNQYKSAIFEYEDTFDVNDSSTNAQLQQPLKIQLQTEEQIQPVQFIPKRNKQLCIKSLNPQLQKQPQQKKKDIFDIMQQIKNESNIRKQKRQEEVLMRILQQLGQQQKAVFQKIQSYLRKGKIKKVQEIIRPLLGKKITQSIMKQIRDTYKQVVNTPLQNSIFLKQNQDGMKFYQLQTQQILDIPEDDITNVLIVGMTGVGKSTYLNALVNYFMEVEMQDNFRYIVSRDMFKNQNGKSSTDKVNIYGMPKQGKMKKAVRLIDIPGLGDTGGIIKDKQNLRLIHQRVQNNVPFINLIIYIFKSSETRITKQTEYVIGQIMGMFAKDVGSNILFVLTFADNQQPNVLKSLKSSFSSIIEKIKQKNKDWYIKVNNSALFKTIDINNQIDTTFYTMGTICLSKTAQIMEKYTKISTKLSLQVMESRQQIQLAIQGLHEQINNSLIRQQSIRDLTQKISNSKAAIEGLQYKVKYKEQKIEIEESKNMTTTCLNCKFTCHKICTRTNQHKSKCRAMKDGKCKICPDKCPWQAHVNDHKIIKRRLVEVEKTIEQIYNKFKIQEENKNKSEQLLLALVGEYTQILMRLVGYCKSLKQLNNKLATIELKKINHATVVQYIQILITNEQNQKSQGYLGRVRQYQAIKNYQLRLELLLKQNQVSEFQKFQYLMRSKIEQLIPNQDVAKDLLQTFVNNYEQIKISQEDMQMIRNNELQIQISPQ